MLYPNLPNIKQGALDIADLGLAQLTALEIANRRLVVFAGSGLSLNYGGPSWDGLVFFVVDKVLAQIEGKNGDQKSVVESSTSTPLLQQLHSVLKKVASKDPRKDTSNHALPPADLQAALEMCNLALLELNALNSEKLTQPTSINTIVATLFDDNYESLLLWFKQRTLLGKPPKRKAKNRHDKTEGERNLRAWVGQSNGLSSTFVSNIFNVNWLEKQAGRFEESIKNSFLKWLPKFDGPDNLPIDQRDLIAVALGVLPDVDARQLLQDAYLDESTQNKTPVRPNVDPLASLIDEYQVKRVITLNYDWNFEHYMMLADYASLKGRKFSMNEAISDKVVDSIDSPYGDKNLTRRLPNGGLVKSETYRPRGAANLFEFALNSQEFSAHIVHLHGRADVPDSIVASSSDYNRVYRRDDSDPKSLERALDVALSGNPVLFVGTGLNEPEITRTFQKLIANGHSLHKNPVFALMPEPEDDADGSEATKQKISYFSRFGLYIFHYGPTFPDPFDVTNSYFLLVPRLRKLVSVLIDFQTIRFKYEPSKFGTRDKHYEKRELLRTDLDHQYIEIARRWPITIPLSAIDEHPCVYEINIFIEVYTEISNQCRGILSESATTLNIPLLKSFGAFLEGFQNRIRSAWLEKALKHIASGIQDRKKRVQSIPIGRELYVTDHMFKRTIPFEEPYRRTHHFRGPKGWTDKSDVGNDSPVSSALTKFVTKVVNDYLPPKHPYLALIGDMASGKGTVLRELLRQMDAPQVGVRHSALVINFSFLLEIESIIDQVQTFLNVVTGGITEGVERNKCRLDNIRTICGINGKSEKAVKPHSTIYLTGLDRMFGSNMQPLSADFEDLIETLVLKRDPKLGLNVVLMVTPPVALWLRRKGKSVKVEDVPLPSFLKKREAATAETISHIPVGIGEIIRSALHDSKLSVRAWEKARTFEDGHTSLETVEKEVEQDLEKLVTFWANCATDSKSDMVAQHQAQLDWALMKLLAVVGAPLSSAAAIHDMAVEKAALLLRPDRAALLRTVVSGFERIKKVGLISTVGTRFLESSKGDSVELCSWDKYPRYAMHRVVLRAFRKRLSIQQGDVLLANSFSLSCATSLPVDVVVPQPDIRNYLEQLFASLLNASERMPLDHAIATVLQNYRYALDETLKQRRPVATPAQQSNEYVTIQKVKASHQCLNHLERQLKLGHVDTGPCLRAAANILRSFFSAASLVTFQPIKDTDPSITVGDLNVHRKRIEDLLSSIRSIENRWWLADLNRSIVDLSYVNPFLSTDPNVDSLKAIVEEEYKKSSLTNRLPPLYGGELVWLHNERATIALIQGDLYEAEFSSRQASNLNKHFRGIDPGHNQTRIDINRSLVHIERGRLREGANLLEEILKRQESNSQLNEKKIVIPLVNGYLAFVAQLSGRSARAEECYAKAIPGLEETNQMRALSVFQMRRATLLLKIKGREEALAEIENAIRAADASSQLDVLWRARLARITLSRNELDSRGIVRHALLYAEKAGLHRVTVEAYMAGAHAAALTSNFEEAEALTAKAMIHANRCGMTLRKISLRIVMGKLLLARGDFNGETLLARAISHADRIGFQSAIQPAQEALLRYSSAKGDFAYATIEPLFSNR